MRTENHYSIFAKSDFYYCVSIEYVREVIKTNSLIITPAQTIGLVGFLDFRNSLCPVLDINAIIQNKKWEEKPIGPYSLMVLEYESTLFAVLIDRFVESLGTDGENGSSEFSFNNKNGQLLIDKTFRYKGMALNRISLEYVKSVILANIKSSGPQQDTINLKIETYEDSGDEIEMICFGIDHLRFGIPITDLVEVIEGYSVEPLFRIHPFLRGLINLRGQIIACVDISQVIGLPPRKMEEKNQYILLQDNNRDLALCIDAISKKQKFKRNQIQNIESIFSGELADYLLGIIETQPDRIFVISGPKIFASKYLLPYQE